MQGCWEMEIREEGEDRCREIVFFFFWHELMAHGPYFSVLSCVLFYVIPRYYSPPGSSVHGDSPGKNTGVGSHSPLQGSSRPRD